jgi:hypothetical protein
LERWAFLTFLASMTMANLLIPRSRLLGDFFFHDRCDDLESELGAKGFDVSAKSCDKFLYRQRTPNG